MEIEKNLREEDRSFKYQHSNLVPLRPVKRAIPPSYETGAKLFASLPLYFIEALS